MFLFRMALNGVTVRAGVRSWKAQCVAARQIAGWRWFQIALSGSPSYTVVLKASSAIEDDEAVRALEWWLKAPGRENCDVIEVSC
jgi:hypothetical protein